MALQSVLIQDLFVVTTIDKTSATQGTPRASKSVIIILSFQRPLLRYSGLQRQNYVFDSACEERIEA